MFVIFITFILGLIFLWFLLCYLFVPKFSERFDKFLGVLEEDIPHKKIIRHHEDEEKE